MHAGLRLQGLAARFFFAQLMKGRIELYIHHVTQYTHTHSHTFTHSGAEGLWWLEASYLFDFKHADSERFDLAFREAAAVTASLAFVGFQAPEKWTRSLSKHTAFLPLSDRVNIFFNASTPTNPQNPQ